MILVDPRVGGGDAKQQQARRVEMMTIFRRLSMKAELENLAYGDFAFEGNGPKGPIAIGVERKSLHDILHCIDDARYSAKQRIGMAKLYRKSFLSIEGNWKPHDPQGILMEGFNGGMSWGPCRYRTQQVMYGKLYRYLLSVALSDVIITYSRDLFQTVFNVCEMYHYFQKPWHKHTSMRETQKLAIPSLSGRPKLVRRWASDIDSIGVIKGEEAARLFKNGRTMANADERAWMRIPGIGPGTAQKIVREIGGL